MTERQSVDAGHFLAVEDGFTSSSKLLKTVSGVSNSSKLLKTVSGVSNIYGTTYGLKYINIYIYIYIENPRIEQTRKLASLAINAQRANVTGSMIWLTSPRPPM